MYSSDGVYSWSSSSFSTSPDDYYIHSVLFSLYYRGLIQKTHNFSTTNLLCFFLRRRRHFFSLFKISFIKIGHSYMKIPWIDGQHKNVFSWRRVWSKWLGFQSSILFHSLGVFVCVSFKFSIMTLTCVFRRLSDARWSLNNVHFYSQHSTLNWNLRIHAQNKKSAKLCFCLFSFCLHFFLWKLLNKG